MFTLAPALLITMMILVPVLSMGLADTSQVPAEFVTCTDCHNDTTLITGKEAQWKTSGHGTGTAYAEEGPNKSCSGCHSGGGFSDRIAAGLQPNQVTVGDNNPTRQDCRACHQIHNTYAGVDWALETTASVNFYAIPGKTFDGGEGNLCASCHQPRRAAPVGSNGVVTGINSHWGPHHGPQSSMMLGTGGAGPAGAGTSAAHYQYVENTCVGCHMGANDNHTYEPNVAACKVCHTTATNFDINGVQTTVQAKMDQLKGLLVTAGLLACTTDAEGVETCSAIVTSAPEGKAYALWNWLGIHDDGSKGVHNPGYTEALLDASIASMPCDGEPVLSMGAANPFWASYADYTAGLLSVRYSVNNNGSANAFNVAINNSSATNSVTPASSLPASVGNITAGASALVTIQYNVPQGVVAFQTINGATAQDNCGTTYNYGTQPSSP
jgi:hypothetical protein